eukprot:11240998-Heterocapsa_arctica.AAC.1
MSDKFTHNQPPYKGGLFIAVLYFPPAGSYMARDCTLLLWRWLSDVMKQQPDCALPIIMLDVN